MVQAIGAAETKLLDFGAPKRIDGEAAIKLVNVAKELGVQQYIMVTSLGTGKFGFPASKLRNRLTTYCFSASTLKTRVECGQELGGAAVRNGPLFGHGQI